MANLRPNLLFCVVLLTLAGCSQQPQTAAPQSGSAPAAAPPAAAQPAPPQHEIQVRSVGPKAEIVHVIKPGTAVVWTGAMPFYIHFLKGDDFCQEPPVARYPGYYGAEKTNAAGSEYRLQCTVKSDTPAATEFSYEILGKLPPKPQPPNLLLHTTPCGGCIGNTSPAGSGQ